MNLIAPLTKEQIQSYYTSPITPEEKKGDFLTSVLNSYKYCTGEDKISFPLITKELKENLGGIPKQTVLEFLTEIFFNCLILNNTELFTFTINSRIK